MNQSKEVYNSKNLLPSEGFIRLNIVIKTCGIARSTVWAWVKQGRFPKPIKISPKVSAWNVQDIRMWLANPADWQEKESDNATV